MTGSPIRTSADVATWDRFVAEHPGGSFMQLSAWAEVKARNGWSAVRTIVGGTSAGIGAQILLRRPRPLPWTYAYAARGPVAATFDAASIEAFTDAVRTGLRPLAGRVSHLRIDPEIEADGPADPGGSLRSALAAAGWRPAPTIQVNSSRIIDLHPDEETLFGDLMTTWRQNVKRGRKAGIVVSDAGPEGLAEFLAIHFETARRAGFATRSEAVFRAVWEAFSARGAARLLFARAPDGEALATLFLLRCGDRVVEPWAGMTARGAAARANYLLKWEAITSSRAQGATSYDMWGGLMFPGIAAFKKGFGGREVTYIGAWDLVLDPVGWLAYAPGRRALLQARGGLRHLVGRGAAGPDPSAAGDD
jgi:serine/alanine adding enzyme